MLGVLKCGAAFVPLDPSFPPDRVAFIAEDASLRVLLTTSAFSSVLLSLRRGARGVRANISSRALFLDADAELIAAEPEFRPDVSSRGDALCYIIYTSGTTGQPKGVAVNQSNICQFLDGCDSIYGVAAADRVYQGMTLAFDFSIEEIWPTFKAGATLVAGPNDHRRFGTGLNDFLIEQQISVLCCVPTLLATLERDVPSLRLLLVGGEACPADLVKRWSRPGRRMLNTYGPTEATVTATWCELLPDRPVTIGKPLPGSTIYILDDKLQPVLPGREGEICIGGPCVASGYVNRPDLTADRFVPDVFSARPGAKLYRTGDLGRVNPAGEIVYLGRIDTQIKIRGMRIELGEIEAALLDDAGVTQAVAAAIANEGGVPELAAYVVPRDPDDFLNLRQRLHDSLRSRLPAYMVPAYIEPISTIPVLPSQKADRSRLPRPTWPRIGLSIPAGTTADVGAAFADRRRDRDRLDARVRPGDSLGRGGLLSRPGRPFPFCGLGRFSIAASARISASRHRRSLCQSHRARPGETCGSAGRGSGGSFTIQSRTCDDCAQSCASYQARPRGRGWTDGAPIRGDDPVAGADSVNHSGVDEPRRGL